jgi:integrase
MYPEPYKVEGRKFYYFRYTNPSTGKRVKRSTGQITKRIAREEIKKYLDKLWNNPEISTATFKQFLDPWTNGKTNPRYSRYQKTGNQYSLRHVKEIKSLIENYVLNDPIAKEPVLNINRGKAVDFIDRLYGGTLAEKPRTVNKVASALRSIFSEAVFRGDLDYNPFSGIGQISYKAKPKEILSPEEIITFFDRNNYHSLLAFQVFRFAAYTGMRMSEILAVTWEQLDGNILKINRAFKSESSTDVGLPKWGKERTIPLPKSVLVNLPKGNAGLIFNQSGFRLYADWWYENFNAAVKNAKIKKKITPHCLRHSLNTNLLFAGVSPFLIQQYLGWSKDNSLTKVQEGYTHVQPEHLTVVSTKIDQLYEPEIMEKKVVNIAGRQ